MSTETGIVDDSLALRPSYVIVSSYTNFSNLAHGPRGTEAKHSLRTFQLDERTGTLTLVAINDEPMNPAFARFHPNLNTYYVCTESIVEEGEIFTYSLDPNTGALGYRGRQGCAGTSTCFITIDRTLQHMLVVNYWDSTLTTLSLSSEGTPVGVKSILDPKHGKQLKASATKHVNHSHNDANTIRERQSDPHSHALVLDPLEGCLAFVPDLGMDVVRQLYYDSKTGKLEENCVIDPGPEELKPHGPRCVCARVCCEYVLRIVSERWGGGMFGGGGRHGWV
jgi:6-phosphogluconolactonase